MGTHKIKEQMSSGTITRSQYTLWRTMIELCPNHVFKKKLPVWHGCCMNFFLYHRDVSTFLLILSDQHPGLYFQL